MERFFRVHPFLELAAKVPAIERPAPGGSIPDAYRSRLVLQRPELRKGAPARSVADSSCRDARANSETSTWYPASFSTRTDTAPARPAPTTIPSYAKGSLFLRLPCREASHVQLSPGGFRVPSPWMSAPAVPAGRRQYDQRYKSWSFAPPIP